MKIRTRYSYEIEEMLRDRLAKAGLLTSGPKEIKLFDGLVQGHTDGEIAGDLLEIKTVPKDEHIPEGRLPFRVYAQSQSYMNYLRYNRAKVLYFSRESGRWKWFEVERNRSVQVQMDEKVKRMVRLVRMQERPECVWEVQAMIRVFPRRTKWTPTDDLAFIGDPPLFRLSPDHGVYISVTFSWDIPEGHRLYRAWRTFFRDVHIGGPAFGDRGEEFIPGKFLKEGAVITSRGCPNECWFCMASKREGDIRELPITEGWNVMDNNILACSRSHFLKLCEMLRRQKERPVFSGGLEAKRLTSWHSERLVFLKPDRLYFAYDSEDDYEPLVEAGKIMREAGLPEKKHILFCYVLIGYPGDSLERANVRMQQTMRAGFTPMGMYYRGPDSKNRQGDKEWAKFKRHWARPRLIYQKEQAA